MKKSSSSSPSLQAHPPMVQVLSRKNIVQHIHRKVPIAIPIEIEIQIQNDTDWITKIQIICFFKIIPVLSGNLLAMTTII